jgi:hypothetical protein
VHPHRQPVPRRLEGPAGTEQHGVEHGVAAVAARVRRGAAADRQEFVEARPQQLGEQRLHPRDDRGAVEHHDAGRTRLGVHSQHPSPVGAVLGDVHVVGAAGDGGVERF